MLQSAFLVETSLIMHERQRNAFVKCQKFLLNNLDPDVKLLRHCEQERVLSDEQIQQIEVRDKDINFNLFFNKARFGCVRGLLYTWWPYTFCVVYWNIELKFTYDTTWKKLHWLVFSLFWYLNKHIFFFCLAKPYAIKRDCVHSLYIQ